MIYIKFRVESNPEPEAMHDPEEQALVAKAFQMAVGARGYVTGYVEWDEKGAHNARRNLSELGLTPEGVRGDRPKPATRQLDSVQ